MILYTPLHESEIFPSEEEKQYEYIEFKGRTVCVKQNNLGEFQVIQLHSTDPYDFLNTSFAPGTILPNEFVQQLK